MGTTPIKNVDEIKKEPVVISLSGGMDSTTLLYWAHNNPKYEVKAAISFNYGQNHSKEIDLAKWHCNNLNIPHKVIDIGFLGEISNSSLTSGAQEIPEGHYAEENMKSTVVPFRNGILLAITGAYAEANNCKYILYGAHAGDHCFSRDTYIITPEGNKNVEQLNIGDIVYSCNINTEKWEQDKVIDILKKKKVIKINKITLETGTELKLTNLHKVYVDGLIKKNVEDLVIGDLLVFPILENYFLNDETTNNYGLVKIQNIEQVEYNDHVFDISVEKNHNFLIGDKDPEDKYPVLISNSIYPDCRPEFADSMSNALKTGTYNKVEIIKPFITITKSEICEIGLGLGVPYEKTWTCYRGKDKACLRCSTCSERTEAFFDNDAKDPLLSDEEWDKAVKIMKEYESHDPRKK